MKRDDLKYWLALKSIPGVGNAAFLSLIERFGSPSNVFSADVPTLCTAAAISGKQAHAIASFKSWDRVLRQLDELEKKGIRILTCLDTLYPPNLLNIYDRPVFLYVLGTLLKEDVNMAVIGSRRASAYGKYTTERFSRELALSGMTVVSGMARGIDSCAHRGALSVSGRTVAVLGCGLDVIYPPENKSLFAEISQNGALVSEFPPGTQPMPFHFPSRNRIISGMSYGVLVVEAGEKSGSLITARLALEQGRDVFAIPGSIDSSASRGSNSLIKQGAKLVESVDDILEELMPQIEIFRAGRPADRDKASCGESLPQKNTTPPVLCGLEKSIAQMLACKKMHADEIIAASGSAPADILSALTTMELKEIIQQHPGNFYSLKK